MRPTLPTRRSKHVLQDRVEDGGEGEEKLGASLNIASQRVVGLDMDVLSQCGTKIVLRMDSPIDLAMLKPILGGHAKLLSHLPTGVALVAGVSVRYPVLVEVRARKTTHGGTGVKLQPKVKQSSA